MPSVHGVLGGCSAMLVGEVWGVKEFFCVAHGLARECGNGRAERTVCFRHDFTRGNPGFEFMALRW